jgi:uncharacterized membrane protein
MVNGFALAARHRPDNRRVRCGGLIDVFGDDRVRNLSDVRIHAGSNILAVLIELYNWYSRYDDDGSSVVVPTGVVLSGVVVLVLLVTAWKGGEMVFRHRVGVAD